MKNKSELKQISYTCPKCKQVIDTFIDKAEFDSKEFPVAITDIHEFEQTHHANTLYIDAQFVIRAVESSDYTALNIKDGQPAPAALSLTEEIIPVPKKNINPKNLGFIENLLLSRIDGSKTTTELASELKVSEKRIQILIKKLQVNGYLKKIKKVIK